MKISPQEALARAKAFLQKDSPSGMRKVMAQTRSVSEEYVGDINFKVEGDASMYLFQDGDTFSVYPSDDTFSPVLAQWEGESEDGTMPPNMMEWLEVLEKEMEEYVPEEETEEEPEEEVLTKSSAPAKAASRTTILPMLDDHEGNRGANTWNQDSPFNTKIPSVKGIAHPLVGCGAVVVGQLIYYWGCLAENKFCTGCYPIDDYQTETKKCSVKGLPANGMFDYENMVGTFSGTTQQQALQKNAVATLLDYVARGLRSDFTSGLTISYPSNLISFMRDKMRLGNNIKFYKLSNVNVVYNELAAGRPVILNGFSRVNEKGEYEGGHFFLCDGYDSDTGLFHINWGWGGEGNGYYALSALDVESNNRHYNYCKQAIYNIQPVPYFRGDTNGDGLINVTDVMVIFSDLNEAKKSSTKPVYKIEADFNMDGQVTADDAMAIVQYILGNY